MNLDVGMDTAETLGIKQIPHYLMYSKRNVEEILGDTVFLLETTIGMARLPLLYGTRTRTVWKNGLRSCDCIYGKLTYRRRYTGNV